MGWAIERIALRSKVKVRRNVASLTGHALRSARNGNAPSARKENINLR